MPAHSCRRRRPRGCFSCAEQLRGSWCVTGRVQRRRGCGGDRRGRSRRDESRSLCTSGTRGSLEAAPLPPAFLPRPTERPRQPRARQRALQCSRLSGHAGRRCFWLRGKESGAQAVSWVRMSLQAPAVALFLTQT